MRLGHRAELLTDYTERQLQLYLEHGVRQEQRARASQIVDVRAAVWAKEEALKGLLREMRKG